VTEKSKTTAGMLAIFLGSFGAHRFYLRSYRLGTIYAVFFWTLIPGILGIIEGTRYLLMDRDDFVSKYSPDSTSDKSNNSIEVPKTTKNRETPGFDESTVELSFNIEGTGDSSQFNEEEKKDQSTKAWIPPNQDSVVNGYNISRSYRV
jgi:TM2 domain-containing membrane protein YozV